MHRAQTYDRQLHACRICIITVTVAIEKPRMNIHTNIQTDGIPKPIFRIQRSLERVKPSKLRACFFPRSQYLLVYSVYVRN
jgi:hypothetical protein